MNAIKMGVRWGLCLLALGWTVTVSMGQTTWGDPRQIPLSPLKAIQVPTPERSVLPNGMIIYLLEDHEFPLVDARALMRVGAAYDPPEKIGLASIAAEVMRSGGSTSIAGDSLDRKLEALGASVEISMRNTEGNATVSTLSANVDEGLRILSDLLRRPAFPEEKLTLAKTQEKTEIAARNDEPMTIMGREFPKLVYGPDHPYARQTEYATIDAITRDDLVAFHKEFFHPDRIILTVYGDFESAKVKKLLSGVFGDWARSATPLPPDPPSPTGSVAGTYLAPKADMTNSMVVLGHLGMRMDDPDYPAMSVLNNIIGGGFSSRLINEIRTKRGLAYATGSWEGAGYHHPGTLLFYAMTQTDSTGVTTGLVRHEVDRIVSEPVTQLELDRARDAVLNALVFTLSSKGDVLNRIAQYEFYGYPKDFLQTYQETVARLTPADLLAAAKRKIRPGEFATLIVGNRERITPGLAALGTFKEIDISIPQPGGEEIPEGTEADFQRGQEFLAAAAAAMGGTALQALKDLTSEEQGTLSIQGMELPISVKSIRVLPDCERSEQKLPMGTMTQVLCGEKGWVQSPQGVQEMPADAMQQAVVSQHRDLLAVLRAPSALKAQALPGTVEVDGKPADVVAVHSELVQGWKIYFDAGSHLIVRMEYRDRSPATGAPGLAQENFTDYREAGNLKWPHQHSVLYDGAQFVTLKTSSMTVNTGVAGSTFDMPAR